MGADIPRLIVSMETILRQKGFHVNYIVLGLYRE